jgi:hypothetical protein
MLICKVRAITVRSDNGYYILRAIINRSDNVSASDSKVEECVDPGGNGAILNVGEGGRPGPPRGEGNRQLASDSEGG